MLAAAYEAVLRRHREANPVAVEAFLDAALQVDGKERAVLRAAGPLGLLNLRHEILRSARVPRGFNGADTVRFLRRRWRKRAPALASTRGGL